jgi:hypothetical protein
MAEIYTGAPIKAPISLGTVPQEKLVEAAPAPIELATASMTVTDMDAMGRKTQYTVTLPTTCNYAELSLPQKIWLLKAGRFSKLPVPLIACAIVYAAQLREQTGANIDELQGDLYCVQNGMGEVTFNLTNKAKIKIANATGRIKGFTIVTHVLEDTPVELDDCIEDHELECTVTLEVEGLSKPIVKVQRLSEWFAPKNPNWRERPRHMLELNTYAHACEFVSPIETGEDEVPNVTPINAPRVGSNDELVSQLTESVELAKQRPGYEDHS